ncbi:hypothetical protein BGZ91_011190 [Linnemannia elongata]|nr:hypothetical protein BGZ91_011190 [Linnemannia elongata]KAG0071467.1 hypothetical protein BGZ90_012235 [Linnemannia elongata]
MTRIFPLVAVFAMLATLCLSTTSAIPVAKREVTPTGECVQTNWDKVKTFLNKASDADKAAAPALFENGVPIAAAPSVEEIEESMGELASADPALLGTFLADVGCSA